MRWWALVGGVIITGTPSINSQRSSSGRVSVQARNASIDKDDGFRWAARGMLVSVTSPCSDFSILSLSRLTGTAAEPRLSVRALLPEQRSETPQRDAPERDRDHRVVAGKRDAEEAPCRLIAAHDNNGVELVEQVAAAPEVGIARAFRRPRPQVPFDPGVIDSQ